jgi:hypothetical protein
MSASVSRQTGRFRFHGWRSSLVLLGLAFPALAWGYSSGPLNGYAGDPPANRTCHSCHSSFQVNSGSGTLAVTGLPTGYLPGITYALTVELSQAGPSRWGFELTALREDNGQRAGSLTPDDPARVQLSTDAGTQRDYLKHTTAGTFEGQPNGVTWNIHWSSPAENIGPAQIYVAGNAANSSGSPFGDYIYTHVYTVPVGGACCTGNGSCTIESEAGCTGTWTALEPCSPEVCASPAGDRTWGRIKELYRRVGE